jgi:hypothetical protein
MKDGDLDGLSDLGPVDAVAPRRPHTVDGATGYPIPTSSPWILR